MESSALAYRDAFLADKLAERAKELRGHARKRAVLDEDECAAALQTSRAARTPSTAIHEDKTCLNRAPTEALGSMRSTC